MELKEKEKVVKIIGNADIELLELERRVSEYFSQGKNPPKEDTQLLKSIQNALDRLKQNPFAGDNIKKELIPRELSTLQNLFRMELSQFWRLLYYVVGEEVRVISIVFEIINHKEYDHVFGYKKK